VRSIFGAVLLAVFVTGPAAAQVSDVPASQRPPCEAAPDGEYGYTRAHAIQVGGSPMFGAARQRRYLESLRGPEGQIVSFKRLGSTEGPDDTILDAYEVTHQGLDKPVTLYLDWYHYTEPRLPRGFSCAAPFNLGLPPVDPFQESRQLRALAVVQPATVDLSPIPLAVAGKPPSAVVYDQFRVLALAARAAAAKEARIDPENPPADLKGVGMIVLAFPYKCEERVFPPAGVAVHGANGMLVPRPMQQALPPEQLARILPGIAVPDGAKAFAYQLVRPRPNDTVVVSYLEDGCDVRGNTLRLPIAATPFKTLETPAPELPQGVKAPAMVLLQGILDFDGRLQQTVYIGGPRELTAAAREAVSRWRAEPARLNGAPIATGVLLPVRFGGR
jgi:hypothetical protein